MYLICCLAVLSMRRRHVVTSDAPFVAAGGPGVPLAAAGIIVWLLSTLSARELAATALLVGLSAAAYTAHTLTRKSRTRERAPSF